MRPSKSPHSPNFSEARHRELYPPRPQRPEPEQPPSYLGLQVVAAILAVFASLLIFAALVSGCGLFEPAAERTPEVQGVVTGVAAAGQALVEGVSALETGGWAAAAVVTGLGLLRAMGAGWKAAGSHAKNRRLAEIAEGVKKANGSGRYVPSSSGSTQSTEMVVP